MSMAVSVPVLGAGKPWGGPRASIAPARSTHAFKVTDPEIFDLPGVVELFERAFSGGNARFDIDPEEYRIYLRDHITEPGFNGIDHWLHVWLAMGFGQGFLGFMIMSYAPWPACSNLCAGHFHVERPLKRSVLLDAALGWARSVGLNRVSLVNQTGASDRAYLRMTRPYGDARVVGSMIECDLKERS